MRIAIPIWENKVSPVLDTASKLLIIELEGKKEVSRFEIYMDEQNLSRRCFRIQGMEVDIIICGAISLPFVRMLTALDIEVIPEISGRPEEVLRAYLKKNLFSAKFLMPGCKRNRSGQKYQSSSVKNSCKQPETKQGKPRFRQNPMG